MQASPIEIAAMGRALELAAATAPGGPNPRVGCVLLAPDGAMLADGVHLGAGTPHAEVAALAAAGAAAAGATAVVTLEPCAHEGRTGPCAEALVTAGIRRVVFAQSDPNPLAAGGAARLRAAGIDVVAGVLADTAAALNRTWAFAVANGRPWVTWKFAATLDGRTAAVDGTSRWISSAAARADAHRLRSECDVVLVGTRTVAVDDPHLSVRDPDGRLRPGQPLRAVMGLRTPDPGRRVLDDAAETLHLRTRDPHAALAELHRRERRHVLLEGGATLAAAFLRAGLVDEVVAYLAPRFLGTGTPVLADLGVATLAEAHSFTTTDLSLLPPLAADDDTNVRLTLGRTHQP